MASHVSRPNEHYIAKLDLRALPLGHLFQFTDRNRASLEGMLLAHTLPMRIPPRVVIEQDTPSHDPLLSPLAYTIDVGLVRAVDVVQRDVVVEALCFLVREMAQSVPLR